MERDRAVQADCALFAAPRRCPPWSSVSLPDSDASHLATILAHAQSDGPGDTTIKLGQGASITFAGVSAAALQKHAGDVVFHG